MTARNVDPGPIDEKSAAGAVPHATGQELLPALQAPPQGAERAETGQPGSGQGRVDVTGIMPEGIRVDPNITEGHPGYEESGDSEIIPLERLSGETLTSKDAPGSGAEAHADPQA